MANFKVRIFDGPVDYEALHAAKLTSFPLEPRDYKPYSQARVCFARDGAEGLGLRLQLLSFEAEPLPDSAMKAVFRFPGEEEALSLTTYADGRFEGPAGLCAVKRFSGEDLQGVYWGVNITVSPDVHGRFAPAPEATFQGNFYKLCRDPVRSHYGSFCPTDWAQAPDAPGNLGKFVCIAY